MRVAQTESELVVCELAGRQTMAGRQYVATLARLFTRERPVGDGPGTAASWGAARTLEVDFLLANYSEFLYKKFSRLM